MGHDPLPASPTPNQSPLTPKRITPLGEIRFASDITLPLGGLNPYSPHFERIGKHFANLLIDHAALTPKSRVLDVGCGSGRLAQPLLEYVGLDNYRGFDINPYFINHCRQSYGEAFDIYDIYHEEYNPTGKLDPLSFEFPYENRRFDVVVALALFNHFRLPWVFQYVRQIARVLKPKGIFMGTFLLLNQQSMEFINTKKRPPYSFPYRTPESWHDFETRPLFNVAQPEEGVRRVFIKSNLMIKEPIRYGEWCLSKIALAGPDVLLARKGGWGH
jgi:SAM-dependent methyltransferase